MNSCNQGRLGSILLAVAMAALVGAGQLAAQGTAYLTGNVMDPSGAAVPEAAVVIKSTDRGTTYTLKTTTDGVYRSPALAAGTYNITVTAKGFQTAITSEVAVLVGQPRGVNFTLKVGSVSQQVEVSAAPAQLRTQEAGLGQTVQYAQVAKLPYFSRSAGVLLSLSPAVRYAGEDVISYGASRYNVAGYTNVNVLIDGANDTGDREDVAQMVLNPSVETLREVKVNESQYSAKYGRDIGPLVQMVTKSGTNQFHGGIYEYFRNEALDTYDGFTRTKPLDRQHMFGGSFGGPIKKDKLFFFGSLEGQKASLPISGTLTVPTAAERAGDFSALGHAIYDPSTTMTVGGVTTRSTCGVEVCNNIINPNYFDSVAAKTLQYFPSPNLPGVQANYDATAGSQVNLWRGVERIDWNISANDNFSFVYDFAHTRNPFLGWTGYKKVASPPVAGGFGFQYFTQAYNYEWTHIFSPTFFMSNRVVDRPRYITRLNPGVDPAGKWAETLGVKNYAGANLPQSYGGDLGFPSFNFNGYTTLGPGFLLFQENPIRETEWDIDLTYVHGNHTISTGFSTEYGKHGAPDQSFPTGNFGFGPAETGAPSARGGTIPNTGDAFASYLLGLTDNASTTLGPQEIWSNWYSSAYVEDNWKLRPNLTINLGLRWDIDGPVYVSNNYGNSFDFYQLNPVSGTPGVVKFLNRPDYPYNNFYNTDWHRISPRFGFAWEVMPKTVIRGGYGIYSVAPDLGANRRAPNLGFTTSAGFGSPDGGVSPAFILDNGFPSYPVGGNLTLLTDGFGAVPVGHSPTTSPTFVDRHWKFGSSQNFNLSISRELPGQIVLEIAGQGVLGRNLPIFVNWNEIPPQFWGITGTNFARRPFPQYGGVWEVKSQKGTTDYYEGYIRVDKHFTKGFTLIANYSYGRSLGFMGGSIYYPQLSRGPAIYDTANGVTAVPYQMSNIAWVYELPFGAGKDYMTSGVAAKVFGGWSVGGIMSFLGGVPFGIGASHDSLNGNSPLGGRVNIIGNPSISNPTPDHWFNTAAFALPAFGQIGNYGGTLLGPSDKRLDISIQKSTNLTERFRLTFVAEAFNATNTLQFGPPDGNLIDSNFGRTLGTGGGLGANTLGPYGARQMQLGLRIDF